jgi:uncharacterized membrane protein YhaH (DUF805 family)
MSWGAFLFGFRGRINRAKYWLFMVSSMVAVSVAISVAVTVWIQGIAAGGLVAAVIVVGVIYLALIVAGIAVGIKRLHDRGKSGWWLLVFFGAPSLLGGMSQPLGSDGIGIIFSLCAFALSIWAFVELGCLRGTVGPNKYGPDPLFPTLPTPAG